MNNRITTTPELLDAMEALQILGGSSSYTTRSNNNCSNENCNENCTCPTYSTACPPYTTCSITINGNTCYIQSCNDTKYLNQCQ